MSDWFAEIRDTLRTLRRNPRHAIGIILTFALGIASVTAVYALIDAVLLKPLPLPGGERIVAIHRSGSPAANLSLPDAVDLRARLHEFEALSAVMPDFALDLVGREQPQRLRGALVESDYFRVIGMAPLLGRLLRAEDDRSGAAPVVVLAESYWRQTLSADPDVIGTRMRLSGVSAEIVGVARAATDIGETGTELWAPITPFAPWAPTSPGSNNFDLVARLQENVTPEAARADLAVASDWLARERDNDNKRLDFTPWVDFTTAPVREGLSLLLAAVGLLLLLATANISALSLVRATRRSAELSLRHALGAGRARLIRGQLIEALVLGGLGGLLGVAVAALLLAPMRQMAGSDVPRLAGASIDFQVMCFALGITLLGALLFSLVPALRMRSAQATARLAQAGSAPSERRTLAMLVIIELTLASALLGGAGLLGRSFAALAQVPLGFEAKGIIAGEAVLPEGAYSRLPAQTQAFNTMVDTLSGEAGVESAAMIVGPPLLGNQGISHSLLVEGRELVDASSRYRPFVGDYFGTMGMRLLAGRGFQRGDDRGERLAWVNAAFAERYLGGMNALGARVAWQPGEASDEPEPQWMRVVGIVPNVPGDALRQADPPTVYAPYAQREANWIRFGTLVARVSGDPTHYREALARALVSADPSLPLGEVVTMIERSDKALARDRFLLQLVALFAGLALVLGLQGVMTVVSFAVEHRRAEIGIRLALGATPAGTVRHVIESTLPQLVAGAALGLVLTLTAARILSGLLYGVSPADPLALVGAALAIVSAGLLAAWIPARAARRVDVASTLRS
ncbi:MAG: ADOP family duplicated permease [Lysobacterales bacterium]